jgi:hypothetical protein
MLTRIMFPYMEFLMSTSHFIIELNVVMCIPPDSKPSTAGWNSASGGRKRSFPMVMTWPSGSS